MCLSRIFRFRHRVIASLIVALLLWSVYASALARQLQENKVPANVVSVEAKSDHITIKYEFTAKATGEYMVRMDLLKKGEPSFKVPLRSVSGDIGVVKSSPGAKEVQWKFASDYPAGVTGGDYYFGITMDEAESHSNLWYYIGGGLAVAVGVMAYIVFGNKATEKTELPSAPVRPGL